MPSFNQPELNYVREVLVLLLRLAGVAAGLEFDPNAEDVRVFRNNMPRPRRRARRASEVSVQRNTVKHPLFDKGRKIRHDY